MATADVETYSEEINVNTALETQTHELASAELQAEPKYELLPVDNESTIIFARERDNGRVARVLLSVVNDSPHLVDWKLRCTTTTITAFPSGSGQIAPFGNEKCLLVWVCPDNMETWQQMEPAKLMFSLHIISINGQITGSANMKFHTQLDMDELCTPDNPPVHNLIIGSETPALTRTLSDMALQTAVEVTEMMPHGSELQQQEFDQPVPQSTLASHYRSSSVRVPHASTIEFSLDRFHDDVARVQLDLINNSKRQVVWKLKTNNENITALPSGSGLIPARGTGKCMLSWTLPENCHSWDNVGSAKLLMSIRIYAITGKLLGEESAKYIVQPNVDHICTTDNLPVHQLVLVSENVHDNKSESTEEAASSTHKKISKPSQGSSTVTTNKKSNKVAPRANLVNDEIVWQIGVICCATVLSYLILKALLNEDLSL